MRFQLRITLTGAYNVVATKHDLAAARVVQISDLDGLLSNGEAFLGNRIEQNCQIINRKVIEW
jgi:hypothetical protein